MIEDKKNIGINDNKEMSFSDHLEELRQRILKSIYSILICIFFSFIVIKPLISFLEIPAEEIRLLQLSPGEFLFVAIKVAGYCGIIISLPYIVYQIILFISPGLTKREKSLLIPAVAGSGILFFLGLLFSWWILVPAAISFFIKFGADIVEPIWSIERYFDFVLLLMASTAIAFQLPVLQFILGSFGILTADKMISNWRLVVLFSAIISAIITPSTDPLTMSLLSLSIVFLFFIGVGLTFISESLRAKTLSSSH
ncbi:MAG: twin-arginine translocase subunit TatC [Prochlorococcus sp. SP3034]|nr:twin-arginine translocase subunit TatC [Prochlorococcus sp. SP3034]|tara:strand:+ start:456 stop:1217 length:762 start_codon:yes stop_codon:yes gene_type:complete